METLFLAGGHNGCRELQALVFVLGMPFLLIVRPINLALYFKAKGIRASNLSWSAVVEFMITLFFAALSPDSITWGLLESIAIALSVTSWMELISH